MTAPAPATDDHRASSIWPLVHAERAALADDLAALNDAQWAHPSLCERWVIEDVVAHLTAGASVGPLRWFAGVLGCLGEIVVHAQDIRRPLGLARTPPVGAVTEVARFYARRNSTVASRTAIEGLRVEATDGPFATGAGPLVSGTTLALTMAMAGRSAYCDDLTGPGVSIVRARCSPG